LLLRLFPVGDVPHNDLDRGPALIIRPCAPPLDGDRRPVKPDDRQFDERRLLSLEIPRTEGRDGIPGFRVDDIEDTHPDDLFGA
jgi:hypothetical protein